MMAFFFVDLSLRLRKSSCLNALVIRPLVTWRSADSFSTVNVSRRLLITLKTLARSACCSTPE